MGRTARLPWLCALALATIPACGDGDAEDFAPTLLTAEAPSGLAAGSGPVLRGGGRGPTGGSALEAALREAQAGGIVRETPGPQATVDEDARIHIPAGALWGTVQAALAQSARVRRARESLPPATAVAVDLPGVAGYVIIGGRRAQGATGIDLALEAPGGGLHIDAVGTAWVAAEGCDAELSWDAETASLSAWRDGLARLGALGASAENGVRVEAARLLPAAEVIPFIAEAAAAGFGAIHVETDDKPRFDTATSGGGNWLFHHQAPTGAWDGAAALGLCGGHRMRGVPMSGDPDEISNAGLTGMVLLAFLGAGYTNRGKHQFAHSVSRGLRHLKSVQRRDGVFPASSDWDDATAHGLAALAMVEAYAMTGSPIFKGSAQRGLDALSTVFWAAGDLPLATVLTAMTLRSAEIVNDDAIKRGKPAPLTINEKLFAEVEVEARRYDDQTGDLRACCGMFTRILCGEDPRKSEGIEPGSLRLVEALEKSGAKADPTLIWLGSMLCFQVGGKPWKRMRKFLTSVVVDRQRKDGHACCLRGSWDPPANATLPGGRVTATAAGALSLVLLYQYSKVFSAR